MAKDKRSFFERLTGTIKMEEREEEVEEEEAEETPEKNWVDEEEKEAELSVDVYQNNDQITIKTMVAGVRPEDLDIAITRDSVTIKGKREEERNIREEDYLTKELYWGTFSRTVVLPQEIDVDEAEAIERYGMLIIRLPKLNKNRQTKLKVRANS
jgi:HSP20 family protein